MRLHVGRGGRACAMGSRNRGNRNLDVAKGQETIPPESYFFRRQSRVQAMLRRRLAVLPFSSLAALATLSTPAASAAPPAPCIAATAACTEWVVLGGGPGRSLIYRTFSLDTRNEAITRALVNVHGASRDADNYFRSTLAAAFLAGALDNTLVIAPRMASNDGAGCTDAP